MGILKGSDVLLFFNDGMDDLPIACQRDVTITMTDALIDVTCKQDLGQETFLAGLREFSFTCDALTDFDVTGDYGVVDIIAAYTARTPLTFTIANPAFTEQYFTGECYCESIELNAGTEDAATYTASFKGTADLQSLVS